MILSHLTLELSGQAAHLERLSDAIRKRAAKRSALKELLGATAD